MINSICKILHDNHLAWFLDSGSLLGIIRERAFLEWDKGIDISVLIKPGELQKVETAVSQIQNLGFHVTKMTWGG